MAIRSSARANGILGDLGSHMIDLARWLVGDIARVSAHMATHVARPGVDSQALDPANDSAVLALEFVNGTQGVIQVSAVSHVAEHVMEMRVRLDGELGRLEVDMPFDGVDAARDIRGARHDEAQLRTLPISDQQEVNAVYAGPITAYFDDLFTSQPAGARLFVDAVLEDRSVSPNFYDGLKAQEVVDAALESHQRGCWVTLPRD